MITKKFGFLLAASILSLAACGQEQASDDEKSEPVTQEQASTEEEPTTEEVVEEEPAEEVTDEETTEAEPAEESSPEAKSGTASDLLSNGEMTSFVFNETGEYSIFCEPHPVMQMTVVVDDNADAMDRVAVDIADYEFGEETITVAPGTIITWTNQDQVQHNVAFE
ncbi:plastocyanin/azurin family copper-binding protein [Planococcus versutus]|uniref:Blue (type 1) copper domain-containing protein n=1 Tax=Planococcus versutus TaxID=1302659 RepID=A0A1B1S4Q0_9BACL|nr:plastocyanin/azurin family copper-binding protein [Planococcus versutus]ANU28171.1 hypothetical protein I858_014360 [Planococcus versutus]